MSLDVARVLLKGADALRGTDISDAALATLAAVSKGCGDAAANPKPSEPQNLNPLNPKPQTPNPKPSEPQTPNPKP